MKNNICFRLSKRQQSITLSDSRRSRQDMNRFASASLHPSVAGAQLAGAGSLRKDQCCMDNSDITAI
ncbi:MAG: hypothetical protein LBH60_08920 [Prevotellaceae bacterium]|nr:hypothetical protein [Prevotellaceae bacterium]